jgi:parvulin-like peptidyl-prolyl isomerase
MISKVLNVSVSPEEIRDYYEENSDQFKRPEQVRASHILICHAESLRCESDLTKEQAKAKAEEVLAMINETNFADLAKQFSQDPGSSARGGDLGFFSRTQMVSAFSEVAFSLDVGEVSNIVETDFGFHIIKVTNKMPETVLSFEQVKDFINETLTNQAVKQAYDELVESLKAQATIQVFYGEDAAEPIKAEKKVTIIEFSDFECPFCAKIQETLDKVKEAYGDRVDLRFKHFPLSIHKNAAGAARAAESASEQRIVREDPRRFMGEPRQAQT